MQLKMLGNKRPAILFIVNHFNVMIMAADNLDTDSPCLGTPLITQISSKGSLMFNTAVGIGQFLKTK